MDLYIIYALTGAALIASCIADPRKTGVALKRALKHFVRMLPLFLVMLVFISIVLGILPGQVISAVLVRQNRFLGLLFATLIGSVTLMPGFVAFPLASILRGQGVPYMVLSAFTTTLMMVGVLTFPLERTYLGFRPGLFRNLFSLLMALCIALATGILFGEVF
jgi:uncharacterized membrane protein YraQ (UPF0718 family)